MSLADTNFNHEASEVETKVEGNETHKKWDPYEQNMNSESNECAYQTFDFR